MSVFEAAVGQAKMVEPVLERGIGELGRLDVVVAQAGIAAMGGEPKLQAWTDSVDTILLGTINAIQASLPHLPDGASITAIGSTAGLIPGATDSPDAGPSGGLAIHSPSGRSRPTHAASHCNWARDRSE